MLQAKWSTNNKNVWKVYFNVFCIIGYHTNNLIDRWVGRSIKLFLYSLYTLRVWQDTCPPTHISRLSLSPPLIKWSFFFAPTAQETLLWLFLEKPQKVECPLLYGNYLWEFNLLLDLFINNKWNEWREC